MANAGDLVGDKYKLEEKVEENHLFECWKVSAKKNKREGEGEEKVENSEGDSVGDSALEEIEFYLLLVAKEDGEIPPPSEMGEKIDTSSVRVLTSLEEDHWIFPFAEGQTLKKTVEGEVPVKLTAGLRILQELLTAAETIQREDSLPIALNPTLVWVKEGNKVSLFDLRLHQHLAQTTVKILESGEGDVLQKRGYSFWPEDRDLKDLEPAQSWILSLGLLGHYLLTGQHPVEDKAPSDINFDLPLEFDTVFKKATASQPEERYSRLSEFEASFSSALELSGISLEEEDFGKVLLVGLVFLALLVAFYFYAGGKNKGEDSEKKKALMEKTLAQVLKKRKEYIEEKKAHKDMVFIPAGEFIMGRTAEAEEIVKGSQYTKEKTLEIIGDEVPARKVHLKGYWIDKYEVTLEDYNLFTKFIALTQNHDRFCHPDEGPKKDHTPLYSEGRRIDSVTPAVGIDWFDAYAFAKFMKMKLPTEAQWEKAAKGTYDLWKKKMGDKKFTYPPTYPWGEDSPKGRAVYRGEAGKFAPEQTILSPVDSHPEGQSIYGVFNMAGNAWEFVRDGYEPDFFKTFSDGAKDPYNKWSLSEGKMYVVIKGGNALTYTLSLRCSHRSRLLPTYRRLMGFRCVLEEKGLEKDKSREGKKKKEQKEDKNSKKSDSK